MIKSIRKKLCKTVNGLENENENDKKRHAKDIEKLKEKIKKN